MSEKPLPKPTTAARHYPHRMPAYEDAEGAHMIREIARKRGGLSVAAAYRMLVREEAARVGIAPAQEDP